MIKIIYPPSWRWPVDIDGGHRMEIKTSPFASLAAADDRPCRRAGVGRLLSQSVSVSLCGIGCLATDKGIWTGKGIGNTTPLGL
ncbi:anaerobic dehydrogenase [Anopheles sinensis]|uniref:Anaerobic dehydrogenase n=1 Tax=Anopheles sinensis TaxID=74873 RepID=A0A084VWI8_ANOSI|nr:anaerobic dehydrogenase [Anopheles sinensis]